MPTQSAEEYLEAIYRRMLSGQTVGTGDLAAMLDVSAPSVSTMLRRLARDGLVQHKRYGCIELTDKGLQAARCVVRRHRIAERLLTDILGLPWERVHDYACAMEHIFDSDLEQAVYEKLARPLLCPHGGRITGEDIPGARALAALNVGEEAVVVRIGDERQETLSYISSLGLHPGVCLRVLSVSPAGDLLQLELCGETVSVGRDIASSIGVLTEDTSAVAEAIREDLLRKAGDHTNKDA